HSGAAVDPRRNADQKTHAALLGCTPPGNFVLQPPWRRFTTLHCYHSNCRNSLFAVLPPLSLPDLRLPQRIHRLDRLSGNSICDADSPTISQRKLDVVVEST